MNKTYSESVLEECIQEQEERVRLRWENLLGRESTSLKELQHVLVVLEGIYAQSGLRRDSRVKISLNLATVITSKELLYSLSGVGPYELSYLEADELAVMHEGSWKYFYVPPMDLSLAQGDVYAALRADRVGPLRSVELAMILEQRAECT